jgi:hypothetical protein
MKATQYTSIVRLICRKKGATALEMMHATASTCVHKRMSELKEHGWTITKQQVAGKSYHRYFGAAPKVKA